MAKRRRVVVVHQGQSTPASASADPIQAFRRELASLEQNGSSHLDRIVLLLSGGAIGVSLTLLDSLDPSIAVRAVRALWPAWIVLGLSLVAVLVSVFMSQHVLRTAIAQLDREEFFKDGVCKGGRCAPWVNRFNGAAVVLCVTGMALLVFSAASNAKMEASMSEQVREVHVPAAAGGRESEAQVLPTLSGAGQGGSSTGSSGPVDVTRGQVLPTTPASSPSNGGSSQGSGGKKQP